MITNPFEQRDKTISHLVKLGDCIGRSIRENVSLFTIESENGTVSYLTESGKMISGHYEIDQDVVLHGLIVQDSSVFDDEERFDNLVSERISGFLTNIHKDELSNAEDSFGDILGLWENRLRLSSVQNKLVEKAERLADIEQIIESDEFQKVVEVGPQLQTFLKENFDKIITVPEVRNAINLSNTVSTAFNFPRLTLEELEEQGQYTLKHGVQPSIYDMICRQELVKREIAESKQSFDIIWATNPAIRKLASTIYESDAKIVDALGAAIQEVPYLALASKRSLFETFTNCLTNSEGVGISESNIKDFASRIFEYKKEVKEALVQSLNERYGVNVQNLQEPASFKSLANTQVVIFETLSRLAPNGSVLKQVMSEMAQSLKGKSGVECIDVNDYLLETFITVGLDQILDEEEEVELRKSDFRRLSEGVSDLGGILETLRDSLEEDSSPSEEDAEEPLELPNPLEEGDESEDEETLEEETEADEEVSEEEEETETETEEEVEEEDSEETEE